ncbi:hypothetical protein DERF_008699 [Dermatophagoides farinae]|uniref:Uncharacterized protein n=1 Tax=Dermatophagoides farinae TaxID=6954 RepID=A0A922I3S6_DERFA|nr:hypothetical protein DERF_008699 [Dermatophagoides farinae]
MDKKQQNWSTIMFPVVANNVDDDESFINTKNGDDDGNLMEQQILYDDGHRKRRRRISNCQINMKNIELKNNIDDTNMKYFIWIRAWSSSLKNVGIKWPFHPIWSSSCLPTSISSSSTSSSSSSLSSPSPPYQFYLLFLLTIIASICSVTDAVKIMDDPHHRHHHNHHHLHNRKNLHFIQPPSSSSPLSSINQNFPFLFTSFMTRQSPQSNLNDDQYGEASDVVQSMITSNGLPPSSPYQNIGDLYQHHPHYHFQQQQQQHYPQHHHHHQYFQMESSSPKETSVEHELYVNNSGQNSSTTGQQNPCK